MLIQKPILVVVFFFVLFLTVILISKFDFTIVPQVQVRFKIKKFKILFIFLLILRSMPRVINSVNRIFLIPVSIDFSP